MDYFLFLVKPREVLLLTVKITFKYFRLLVLLKVNHERQQPLFFLYRLLRHLCHVNYIGRLYAEKFLRFGNLSQTIVAVAFFLSGSRPPVKTIWVCLHIIYVLKGKLLSDYIFFLQEK